MKHQETCVCQLDSFSKTKYFLPQLQQFRRLNRSNQIEFLKKTDICFIRYLSECCDAVLRKVIRLPNKVYHKLKKHKKDLLFFANRRPSYRRKRGRLIEQRGGFIQFLLPALASSIVALGSNLIGSLLHNQ
jgi:hypothetical protein